MRGKETDSRRQCCSAGITPAYAGKRTLFCLAGRRNRDHPRACGEKPRSAHQRARLWGSPPRMRGKEGRIAIWACMTGITPAYAGKRTISHGHYGDDRDHPRVCGEKNGQACNFFRKPGSPPRMRGKAQWERTGSGVRGITPAYAGKRHDFQAGYGPRWDHPRVCGEKLSPVKLSLWMPGSPPRMRGKGRQLDVLVHGVRITPAYAGKRACTAVCSTNATGSPPRMRGKAFPQGVHVVVVGITPAYAGKSHADHQRRQLA